MGPFQLLHALEDAEGCPRVARDVSAQPIAVGSSVGLKPRPRRGPPCHDFSVADVSDRVTSTTWNHIRIVECNIRALRVVAVVDDVAVIERREPIAQRSWLPERCPP
jgi:hypothetical protein